MIGAFFPWKTDFTTENDTTEKYSANISLFLYENDQHMTNISFQMQIMFLLALGTHGASFV